MTFTVAAVVLAFGAPVVPVPELTTELWQVAPDTSEKPWIAPEKASEKTRAVVLIHGLYLHPLHPFKATQPWRRDWQEPKSELVKTLAKDSDVFAFAYSQTAAVEEIVQGPGLGDTVSRLRKAGYKEVVFVGHSAGAVIAREFVERYPEAGVTKVVAVAGPLAGAKFATYKIGKIGYPKVQAPFVHSLAPLVRIEAMRANKAPLDKDVQIVCVVCKLKLVENDGIVTTASQWPEDLQKLGVPVVLAPVSHFSVMREAASAKQIAELVREKLTRWTPEEVAQARKVIFGETTVREK